MNSYLTHFGLNKAPFSAHVVGNNVFIAPQVAAIVAALKKALSTEDAVVSLSGPVGSGKTTIAKRALEGLGQNRGIVTIGRMPFGHDEVLEILLAGLGARQLPKSTVHRFATFRRMLQQFAEQNTRVFILVEDAIRIGLDALSELEALTAADAGVSNGANLVLLGDDSINELLRDPKLARLKQRLRSRQKIEAQSENELQGYLKHCFRLAGREFDTIFAEGSAKALHRVCDGLPRVVNNLIESALKLAAEKGQTRITPQMIEQVGAEEFGLTLEHGILDVATVSEKAAAVENIQPPKPEPEVAVEAVPTAAAEEDIPELIQDTLPDLEILAPDLDKAPEPVIVSRTARPPPPKMVPAAARPPAVEPAAETAAEPVHEPTENELPVLTSIPAEARDEDGRVPTEIPAWDRDPTLAELRPDLEALERAMAIAQGPDAVAASSKRARNAASQNAYADDVVDVIPEITLDKQIEAKIQEATEALKKTQLNATAEARSGEDASNDDESVDQAAAKPVPNPAPKAVPKPAPQPAPASVAKPVAKPAPKPELKPAVKPPPVANKPAPVAPVATKPPMAAIAAPAKDPRPPAGQLEKIASSIARARTIEDVDDYMAETLFGEEFSMLAAQVAANASLHAGAEAPGVALSLMTDGPKQSQITDTSPSQRLKVLRELNKTSAPRGAPSTPDSAENIVLSGGGLDTPPTGEPVAVDSIEDQITTSMTQTLKTLSIRPTARSDSDDDDDDDDGDDDSDNGFFSRFRRK
jgi:type II secretory pathway predicted ATPase ExeA